MAGDIATAMAAAPINRRPETPKVEPRIFKSIPFELLHFTLPNKSEAFPPNEDGSRTTRLAYAIMRIRGSKMEFRASIYKVVDKSGEESAYVSMPTTGKGFPRPIFEATDDTTKDAYNGWRVAMIEDHFLPWWEMLKGENGESIANRPASNYRVKLSK